MNTKKLTEKQEVFLNNLMPCGGDLHKAAELAGYASTSHSSVIKSLKTEILDMAETILAQNAPKAALKLVEVINSDQPVPQANVKMQAAQTLLDRVGLGKKDKLDINVSSNSGLFILPAKKETIIEGSYEEN
jgi:glycerate-2-kinase